MHSRLERIVVLCTSSSHILLAKGHCLLALANDLVTRDKTSEVKKLFARRRNLLVPDDLTGIFLNLHQDTKNENKQQT